MNLVEILRDRLKASRSVRGRHARSPNEPTEAFVRSRTSDASPIRRSIEQALTRAGLMRPAAVSADAGASRKTSPDSTQRRGATNDPDATRAAAGTFASKSFSNADGTRTYKLYVPASYAARTERAALVVMLHGCTQSADDFAAGTQMNLLADVGGFLVVYPEQPARANGSRCWNWFVPFDQQRDHGEPSLISGITLDVANSFDLDRSRIFVAGLSAGAAMAVVLGEIYPDIYAAVGAHSGLPFGSAHDVTSAFSAMKHPNAGRSAGTLRGNAAARARIGDVAPRTIIFHGDNDSTVHVENGVAIEADALGAAPIDRPFQITTEEGHTASGRSYERTTHIDDSGRTRVERWTLRGAGHAWSGGSSAGSFTDPGGVDASSEMTRFFGLIGT